MKKTSNAHKNTLKRMQFLAMLFGALLFSNVVFSQNDTTLCINIKIDESSKQIKNCISFEAIYPIASLLMGDYGLGLNYERLITKHNSLMVSLSGVERNFKRTAGNDRSRIFYYKLEWRFYLSPTKNIIIKSLDGKPQIEQTKQIGKLQGLYCGALLAGNITHTKLEINTSRAYYRLNDFEDDYRETYDIGVGCSLGYQYIFKNKYVINLSAPLTFGQVQHYKVSHDIEKEKITEYKVTPMLHFNMGIAF